MSYCILELEMRRLVVRNSQPKGKQIDLPAVEFQSVNMYSVSASLYLGRADHIHHMHHGGLPKSTIMA